jgi:hypothetical protein
MAGYKNIELILHLLIQLIITKARKYCINLILIIEHEHILQVSHNTRYVDGI